MRYVALAVSLLLTTVASADVRPATFDIAAIRDPATLEAKTIQDWKPAPKLTGVKQKLIEITVCEWWPGQKVRLPVTFCVPDTGKPCTNVLLVNMGLSPKPAVPSGAELELLTKHGVGVVMVGMGTLDAMEPKGELHLGMKAQLLKTKDARYTPAWIWGMSDMRGLTAAIAERDAFQPKKVLVTGGSKRGVGATVAGVYDDRVTAILPVVAPILGSPGGAYVRGSALLDEDRLNRAFLNDLPAQLPSTAKQALEERDDRRADQSISKDEALAAGWSEAEMLQMNEEAWKPARITSHLDGVRRKGLEFFYHVGTNDNVCPALWDIGSRYPDFPLYILPGGQHGGPQTSGFTLQTPTQPEADQNLLAFARHHYFAERSLPGSPKIEGRLVDHKLHVTVTFTGAVPQRNTLSWCIDRSPAYTLAAEYDHWEATPLKASGKNTVAAEIDVPATAKSVDFVTTHTDDENGLPFHFAAPYQRVVAGK